MAQSSNIVFKSATYIKDTLAQVRSKPWAEPLGISMKGTASVLEILGTVVPGLGFAAGALKLGGSIFNPDASLAHLKDETTILKETILKCNDPALKTMLQQRIEDINEKISNTSDEILQDLEEVRKQVQDNAKLVAEDMKNLEVDITEIKDVVHMTFKLAIDIRFRESIEEVEAAFDNYLDGAENLETTFKSLENYIYEFQAKGKHALGPEKIRSYLKATLEYYGIDMCHKILNYVLVVRAKYLQLVVAYFTFNIDTNRVTKEFDSFNLYVYQMQYIYKDIVGSNFVLEDPPSAKPRERITLSQNENPNAAKAPEISPESLYMFERGPPKNSDLHSKGFATPPCSPRQRSASVSVATPGEQKMGPRTLDPVRRRKGSLGCFEAPIKEENKEVHE